MHQPASLPTLLGLERDSDSMSECSGPDYASTSLRSSSTVSQTSPPQPGSRRGRSACRSAPPPSPSPRSSGKDRPDNDGMDLRPELRAPNVTPEQIREISAKILRIEQLIHNGNAAEAERAVADFNAQTGHDYTALDFVSYEELWNLASFAREAARPAHPEIPDISHDELVEIVRRIQAADPNAGYYLRLFRVNVPHPRASDLIFHPSAADAATPEGIVDTALAYHPIVL